LTVRVDIEAEARPFAEAINAALSESRPLENAWSSGEKLQLTLSRITGNAIKLV
jgi:hypothetical protein